MQTEKGLTSEEKEDMKQKMRQALDQGIGDIDSGRALGYALIIGSIEAQQQQQATELKRS